MSALKLCCPSRPDLDRGFERIREELSLSTEFSQPVLACADAAVARGPRSVPGATGTAARIDQRALPLVTIDPPGSRDLDQAFHAERRGAGYRVWYAIADVASFVAPGDAIDVESLARGVTFYAPDRRIPLHPPRLSEGVASLLPAQDTACLLWTLDLDDRGELVDARLVRALARSRAALSYGEVQRALDEDRADEPLRLLAEIGTLRRQCELARGGVSLNLPSQEVEPEGEGYRLVFDAPLPVEQWNAQISLLAGMTAAEIMCDEGVGLLRTLPAPSERTLEELRATARALEIPWPAQQSYPDFVRGLDPRIDDHAVMMVQAARGMRGAGYVGFDGGVPRDERGDEPRHFALATRYAHVTAPLRRVCDRFANEIVLALCRGERPPGWALAALETLPERMQAARRRESAHERAIIDYVEALVLEPRVGEEFDSLVTHQRRGGVMVQIHEPAVRARVDGVERALGDPLRVRLAAVDVEERRLRFEGA